MTATTYDSTTNLENLTVKTLNVAETITNLTVQNLTVTGTATIPTEDVTELLLSNGTAGTPSLSFEADPTTGLFYIPGNLEFSAAGTVKLILSPSAIQFMNGATNLINISNTYASFNVPIFMNGLAISNVASPVLSGDVVTKSYFEARGGSWWNIANSPNATTIASALTYYPLTAASAVNNCIGGGPGSWTSPAAGVIQWNGPNKVATVFFSAYLTCITLVNDDIYIKLAKNGVVFGPNSGGSYTPPLQNALALSSQVNVAVTNGDTLQIYVTTAISGDLVTANTYSITAI